MKFIQLLAITSALALAGCVMSPSKADIAFADFGTKLNPESAQQACREWLSSYLKDYDSAKFVWGSLHKASYKAGEMRFGYIQEVSVNAKNSFGGYTGFKPYSIFIERGRAIANVNAEMHPAPFLGVVPLVQTVTILD